MASLIASALHLYLDHHPAQYGKAIGRLDVSELEVADAGTKAFRLVIKPSPAEVEPARELRWLALSAEMWSFRLVPRRYGSINIPARERPNLVPTKDTTVRWLWTVPADELELIDRDRADAPGAPVGLRLDVRGIAEVDGVAWGVWGDSNLTVPNSEWISDTARLGYATPPSILNLGGNAATSDPAWSEAERRLTRARAFLRSGEGAEALEAAFKAFDQLADKPYVEADLTELVRHLPKKKQDAISRLLAAGAAYLSTLGRHPDFERDAAGDRIRMPLNHWEAEVGVGVAQLLLTYALRLRDDAQRDAPRTPAETSEVGPGG